jgi:tetratricopeptide (TPR) repeat protein
MGSLREQFLDHHKRAEYAEAYAVLHRDKSVATSAADFLKAADAARYSGHPAEAVKYLQQIPARDALGPSARFTLGRLYLHELGNPAQAASAFAEVQRLAPGGPLSEDALFRETEARSGAGQASAARTLAEKYIRLYPQSRRRQAVERFGGLK